MLNTVLYAACVAVYIIASKACGSYDRRTSWQ